MAFETIEQECVYTLAKKCIKKLSKKQQANLLHKMVEALFDNFYDSDEARIDQMQEVLTEISGDYNMHYPIK